MSIDDSFLRDPRVKTLARLSGWSVQQARGYLLEVWAICYDRVSVHLSSSEINETVNGETVDVGDFAARMREAGLATPEVVDGSDVLRVKGVEERIEYLKERKKSGRKGGRKSGETRRKRAREKREARAKHSFANNEAPANPPDPVPDLVSVPVSAFPPVLDPEPDSRAPARARDPALPVRMPCGTIPPPLPVVVDEPEIRKRQILAHVGQLHAQEFNRVRAEIGSSAMPRSVVGSFTALRDLLSSLPSLDDAQERCEHAIAICAAEARHRRTLQYFGDGMWDRKRFDKALTLEIADVDGSRAPLVRQGPMTKREDGFVHLMRIANGEIP